MGRILLVEPHKILRQAVSLFLFPEHEVQVEEGISASAISSLSGYDLLIIDGAALRQMNQLSPDLVRAVRGCKMPTLWLEEAEGSQPVDRDRLVVVKKPVERERFQSALADLLSPQGAAKRRARSSGGAAAKAEAAKGLPKGKRAEPLQQATFQFIELVDVVEEQPARKQGAKTPKKSK